MQFDKKDSLVQYFSYFFGFCSVLLPNAISDPVLTYVDRIINYVKNNYNAPVRALSPQKRELFGCPKKFCNTLF